MKKYFILAAAVLTLGACSNDEGNNVAVNNSEINLTSRVAGTRTTDQDIQATQINNGQSVWVEFTTDATPTQNADATTTAGDGKWNTGTKKATAAYTANGSGDLTTSNPVKWPINGTDATSTVSIKAWSPFSSTPGTTFTVETDQTTEANYLASDYLYGTVAAFNKTAIASPVQIQFDHMLSKINVNISTTDPAKVLAGATVTFCPTTPSGTASAADMKIDGSINTNGTVTAGTTTGQVVMTSSLEAANTASAIIIPQTITVGTASSKQLFKIELVDGTTVCKYDLTTTKTFDPKKVYTYNITISDGETIILSEQINDWTPGTNESIIAN